MKMGLLDYNGFIVHLTEFRISREMGFWACLWGIILILFTEVGTLLLWVASFPGYDPRLSKWRKRTQ